jgi:hypothetical protein
MILNNIFHLRLFWLKYKNKLSRRHSLPMPLEVDLSLYQISVLGVLLLDFLSHHLYII